MLTFQVFFRKKKSSDGWKKRFAFLPVVIRQEEANDKTKKKFVCLGWYEVRVMPGEYARFKERRLPGATTSYITERSWFVWMLEKIGIPTNDSAYDF